MPMTDPDDPQVSGDDVAQQRLLALLEHEIAKAAAGALARGTDPGALARYVDSRAALLRAEIAAGSRPSGEDGTDRRDDAA